MKKKVALQLTLLAVLFCVYAPALLADRGAFVVSSEAVNLSENAQKAIILHNPKTADEVLILNTELETSSPAKVLCFIPFPSEPAVSLAPPHCFDEAGRIIAKHKLSFHHVSGQYRGSREAALSEPVESVKILSQETLGSHDITVVKVDKAGDFIEWVKKYLERSKDKVGAGMSEKLTKIVEDYTSRNIQYFVFDAVTIDKSKVSIEPLIYKFKTGRAYYPLKSSNSIGGTGEILLIGLGGRGPRLEMMQARQKVKTRQAQALKQGYGVTVFGGLGIIPDSVLDADPVNLRNAQSFFGAHARARSGWFKYSTDPKTFAIETAKVHPHIPYEEALGLFEHSTANTISSVEAEKIYPDISAMWLDEPNLHDRHDLRVYRYRGALNFTDDIG